jgi:transposase
MRRGRDEWRELVANWKRSGGSAREFAEYAGVNKSTLQHWKWVLERDEGYEQRGAALARIVEVRPAVLAATDDRFEVRVVGGRSVRVPASFDGQALLRLLRVLEGMS